MSRSPHFGRRSVFLTVLVTAVGLLVLAFSGAASGLGNKTLRVSDLAHGKWGPGTHVGGGTLKVRLLGDWSAPLMPPPGTNGTSLTLATALYDKLVDIDTNGKVIPYLATSWQVTPTQIVFHLRKGPTCADGTPVTPAVVAQGINYWVKQKSVWTSTDMGAGPITAGANNKAGTVTVMSGTPKNDLLSAFADEFAAVVCPAGLTPSALQDSTHSYGSGPYEIVSAVHNQSITMKLRPNWNWGPVGVTAQQLPATLVWQVVPTDSTAANELLSGQLDVAAISGPDIGRLLSNSKVLGFEYPSTIPNLIQLNLSRPVLQNKAVREGLLMAINAKQYAQAAVGQYGTVPNSIFGPQLQCYADVSSVIPKTDPQAAQKMLQSAGYQLVNGKLVKGGQPLTITISAKLTQNSGPEYLADALSKIGVTVNLHILSAADFSSSLRAGNWDLIAPTFAAASPAPTGIVKYLYGPTADKGGYNFGRINSNIWARLIGYAYKGKTGIGTCELWKQVQQYFFQQAYGLPGPIAQNYFFTRGIDVKSQADILSAWGFGRRKS
jgi:peptide/nickel transport system substrate-binding protein